jgi:hypothetical protein
MEAAQWFRRKRSTFTLGVPLMVELVFIACLKVMTTQCEERSHSFFAQGTGLFTCMMQAQPHLAQWAVEHPNLTVMSWKCRAPDSRPVKA